MSSNCERDYIAKHRQIRNKLLDLAREGGFACVEVSQLASKLGMDIRTVRAHLKVMEVDTLGVFTDPTQKQFCTKEGISILANMLKPNEKANEP